MARSPAELAAVTTQLGTAAGGSPAVHGLARRGSMSLAGSAVASAGQLALTVVVARALAPADTGLFFSATSMFLLLSAAARLGTQTGLVWALSGQRARQERELIVPTVRLALLPVAVCGTVVAVAMLAGADRLAPLLLTDTSAEHVHRMATLIRALAVFVPIAACYDGVCAATRGAGAMRPTVLVERVARPLAQCMAVAAVAWTASATWVTLAWAVPYAVALLLVLRMTGPLLRGAFTPRWRHVPPPAGLRASFWRFTLPRAVSTLAQTILQRLDIVLVGAIRGPQEAAVYAAATRVLVLGQTAAMAISLAVQPNLGEELGRGDLRAAATVYRTSTAWLIVVTWPIYLLSLLAPELILSVFGRGYEAGATVIRVLAAAMLVATGCGMVDMVLTMAGRTMWNLANVGIGAVVFVGLDLLLIPRWGIEGAAVGWAVAILVNNLLPLAQVGLGLGLHPFGRCTLLAAAGAASTCFLLPGAVLLALPGHGALPVLAVLSAAGLLHVGLVYALRRPLGLDRLLARRGRPGRQPRGRHLT